MSEEVGQSVVADLAKSRTLLVFHFCALGLSTAFGMVAVAAVGIATIGFGSDGGYGFLTAAALIGGAALTLPAGILLDRGRPRWILVAFAWALGVGVCALAALVATNNVSAPALVVFGFLLGGFYGAIGLAVFVIQAALVRPSLRASAEVVNVVRIGLGTMVGALVGGLIGDGVTTLISAGVLFLVASAAAFLRTRNEIT